MPLIAPAAEWDSLSRKMAAEVPEVFASEGRVLNLFEGEWKNVGFERHYTSAIDGRSLGRIPMLDLDSALAAGKFAKSEARSWAAVDLDERRRRVSACLAGLKQRRELIALLLMWEIGKPHAQALTDIDRCISGVEWCVQNIESMLAGRSPLGLISEPFGPLDSILVVDHLEELISEMNVSNGALVSSIACDDARIARRVASELRAFKVGVNSVRSRGDREEVFGGIGQSWKCCFVGGS